MGLPTWPQGRPGLHACTANRATNRASAPKELLIASTPEVAPGSVPRVADAVLWLPLDDATTGGVTTDDRLLRALLGTSYGHLLHSLADVGSLIPGTLKGPRTYCNRTATGLVQAGTQQTNAFLEIA